MNDRFKFRVWDKEKNEMECDLYDEPGDMQISCINEVFKDYLSNNRYIVEQCTGLKDKNGKSIYDGDILQDGEQKIKVVFDEERHCFMFEYQYTRAYKPISCLDVLEGDFEIIGNIHENPDLLEELR